MLKIGPISNGYIYTIIPISTQLLSPWLHDRILINSIYTYQHVVVTLLSLLSKIRDSPSCTIPYKYCMRL